MIGLEKSFLMMYSNLVISFRWTLTLRKENTILSQAHQKLGEKKKAMLHAIAEISLW